MEIFNLLLSKAHKHKDYLIQGSTHLAFGKQNTLEIFKYKNALSRSICNI